MAAQMDPLNRAQRLFRTLEQGNVPVGQIPQHIARIEQALVDASTNPDVPLDFGVLKADVSHAQAERYFAALTVLSGEGEAAEASIEALRPEMGEQEFNTLFANELDFAQKANALDTAKRLLGESMQYGDLQYNATADRLAEEQMRMPYLFAKAGLDTSVFKGSQPPELGDLLATVREAETELTRGRGGHAR